MEELFEDAEKRGMKVAFGLEAQGHIPIIQAELKRWNDSFKEQFPNEKHMDMTYSIHVWDSISKIIGWCPFTAALSYFEWLNTGMESKTLITSNSGGSLPFPNNYEDVKDSYLDFMENALMIDVKTQSMNEIAEKISKATDNFAKYLLKQ